MSSALAKRPRSSAGANRPACPATPPSAQAFPSWTSPQTRPGSRRWSPSSSVAATWRSARRRRPETGPPHAERPRDDLVEEPRQRCPGAADERPAEQHVVEVAVADRTGRDPVGACLRVDGAADHGDSATEAVELPMRHEPGGVGEQLPQGRVAARVAGQPPLRRVVERPQSTLGKRERERHRRHDLRQRREVVDRVALSSGSARRRPATSRRTRAGARPPSRRRAATRRPGRPTRTPGRARRRSPAARRRARAAPAR